MICAVERHAALHLMEPSSNPTDRPDPDLAGRNTILSSGADLGGPSQLTISLVGLPLESEPARALISVVAFTLSRHGVHSGEVCINLVDDEEIARLNQIFRQISSPTDVLTFPAPANIQGDLLHLGDVAISVPYAARQAQARGVTLVQEIQMLAIHGALHLVGFDDIEPEDQAEMQREMAMIADLLGLPPEPQWQSILPHEEEVGASA